MNNIKIELIRLVKFPIAALTVVIVIIYLGIDVGNIKKVGIDGIEFHPDNIITTTKKTQITSENNIKVEVPVTSEELIANVSQSTYSEKPESIGWVYLGTYLKGSWNDRLIEISDFLLPEINKSYIVVANSISVRTGKPSFPFYGLKNRIGFADNHDLIKILEIDTNLGRNRVWAKVEIYSKKN